MECWICGTGANAACRFCGRAVCKAHAKTMPFVFSIYRSKTQDRLMALAIEDAIHCGVCHPKQDPVRLDFIE